MRRGKESDLTTITKEREQRQEQDQTKVTEIVTSSWLKRSALVSNRTETTFTKSQCEEETFLSEDIRWG
jgi:hypothetical protein